MQIHNSSRISKLLILAGVDRGLMPVIAMLHASWTATDERWDAVF